MKKLIIPIILFCLLSCEKKNQNQEYLNEYKDYLLDIGESIVKKPGEAENNNW